MPYCQNMLIYIQLQLARTIGHDCSSNLRSYSPFKPIQSILICRKFEIITWKEIKSFPAGITNSCPILSQIGISVKKMNIDVCPSCSMFS